MSDKLQSQSIQLSELKAKLEIYEKWHNEESRLHCDSRLLPESERCTENEIELRELWAVIWRGKWKVIVITTVFAIASVFYALSLPNVYKSEALLMPNSQEKQGGMSALAGQFGGLASLAGINLGSSGTDKTAYALEVLKSREFLYKFIQDNNLKVAIMAAKGWSRETNELIYDNDIYDAKTKTWIREVKAPFKPEPSLQETFEKFVRENLYVSQDKDLGMVTIAVSHYSPYLAKQFVEQLTNAINIAIKKQDMAEATKSIRYFEKELQTTNISGAQSMFYKLIEQQQQKLMLTKVRDDYVLKIVDGAIVPEEKDKPSRAIIVLIASILGNILSLAIVLLINYFKQTN